VEECTYFWGVNTSWGINTTESKRPINQEDNQAPQPTDQVVIIQVIENLSSFSNPQTLTTVTLQKQRNKISHQEGMKEKVPKPNL
jgi:hypothetical protein